jgi:hypothetical protein
MFEIYVGGDPAFFQSVATFLSLLYSGDNIFYLLAGVGAMLGILHIVFKGAGDGGTRLELGKWGIGIVVAVIMFGNTATVVVVDSATGVTEPPVDNVPWGPAAAFYVVSNSLYTLGERFSQAADAPSLGGSSLQIAELGHSGYLEMLYRFMRARPDSARFFEQSGGGYKADIERGVKTYLQDCTRIGIQQGVIDISQIQSGNDTLQAIALPTPHADIFTTRDFIGSEEGVVRTCNEAYVTLAQAVQANGPFYQAMMEQMAEQTGRSSPADAAALMDGLLGDVLANTAGGAWQHMQNAIMAAYVEEAEGQGYLTAADVERVTLLTTSEQRTMTQAMLDANMFARVARPLMGFIEGVIFAMSPVIAFLVAFGVAGIGMALKYLKFILWVGMWPMFMTFSHWFTAFQFSNAMEKLNGSFEQELIGGPLYLAEVQNELIHWVTTGATMMASIPMLTYAFISGAPVAFAGLAGAMSGSSAPEASGVSPQAFQSGSMTSTNASRDLNPLSMLGGYAASNSQTLNSAYSGGVSLGVGRGQILNESASLSEQSSRTVESLQGKLFSEGVTASSVDSVASDFRQQMETANNQDYSRMFNAVRERAEAQGFTDTQATSIAERATFASYAGMDVKATAGLGLPKMSPVKLGAEASLSAGAKATDTKEQGASDTTSKSEALSFLSREGYTTSSGETVSLRDTQARGISFGSSQNAEDRLSADQTQAFREANAHQELSQTMRQEMNSDAYQSMIQNAPDAATMHNNLINAGFDQSQLAGSSGLMGLYQQQKEFLQSRYGMTDAQGLDEAASFRAIRMGLTSDDANTRGDAWALHGSLIEAATGQSFNSAESDIGAQAAAANANKPTSEAVDAGRQRVENEVAGIRGERESGAAGGAGLETLFNSNKGNLASGAGTDYKGDLALSTMENAINRATGLAGMSLQNVDTEQSLGSVLFPSSMLGYSVPDQGPGFAEMNLSQFSTDIAAPSITERTGGSYSPLSGTLNTRDQEAFPDNPMARLALAEPEVAKGEIAGQLKAGGMSPELAGGVAESLVGAFRAEVLGDNQVEISGGGSIPRFVLSDSEGPLGIGVVSVGSVTEENDMRRSGADSIASYFANDSGYENVGAFVGGGVSAALTNPNSGGFEVASEIISNYYQANASGQFDTSSFSPTASPIHSGEPIDPAAGMSGLGSSLSMFENGWTTNYTQSGPSWSPPELPSDPGHLGPVGSGN